MSEKKTEVFDMNQEFIELYVCEDIRQLIASNVRELKGVNKRMYTAKLLYIVSRLHWKQIHRPKKFIKDGAPLRIWVSNEALRKDPKAAERTLVSQLATNSKKATNMVHTLEAWGAIKVKNPPVPGRSATTYTFTDRFANSEAQLQPFTAKEGKFVVKLLEEQDKAASHPLCETILNVYRKHVTLSEEGLQLMLKHYGHIPAVRDVVEAHRNGWFEDNREALLQALKGVRFAHKHERLSKLLKRQFACSVSSRTGRAYHLLTSLPKGQRKYVLLDGKPMIETDIVNCQPALSVALINRQLRTMHGENFVALDMVKYENNCNAGSFYETVAGRANIDISTPAKREKFKKDTFYSEVFYCRNNNWNTPTQVAFRELFPNGDAAIRELKKENHQNFAVELQRLESDAVLHTAFVQLLEAGHVALPLHDAIYTNLEEARDQAEHLVRQILRAKHCISITFHSKANPAPVVPFSMSAISKEQVIANAA